jgi:hypothetical protein
MATVEGLFNFDEKLLARQVAGQREDAMFGNTMPKGYGAIGSGWNQMLRGVFNNDNPILKEKAIAEEALQMTQQQLGGDMTDPAKMYSVLMKNLTDLGASPDSITKVSQRQTEAASSQATASLAASQQEFTNVMALSTLADKKQMNQEAIDKNTTKGMEVLEKQLADQIKIEPKYMENQALSVLRPTEGWNDFDGGSSGQALEVLTKQLIRAKGPDGKPLFNGLSDAVETAKTVLVASGPEAGNWWWSNDQINTDELYKVAAQEVQRRGGTSGGTGTSTQTEQQEAPMGPAGATFVETLSDGRHVFQYEDGREVVTKGTN